MEDSAARLLHAYAVVVNQLLHAVQKCKEDHSEAATERVRATLTDAIALTKLHLGAGTVTQRAEIPPAEQCVAFSFVLFELEMVKRDRDALRAMLAGARKGSRN